MSNKAVFYTILAVSGIVAVVGIASVFSKTVNGAVNAGIAKLGDVFAGFSNSAGGAAATAIGSALQSAASIPYEAGEYIGNSAASALNDSAAAQWFVNQPAVAGPTLNQARQAAANNDAVNSYGEPTGLPGAQSTDLGN